MSGAAELVTGEAVPLELRLARTGSRALAQVIDFFLQAVALLAVSAIVSGVAENLDDAAAAAIVLTVSILVFLGYPVASETFTRGRTLGKAALGLRVVRDDGGAIRFRQALLRGLAGVFVDFFTTLGLGALLSSMVSERSKRLGDVLAGTIVVQERVAATFAAVPPMPPPLAGWASGTDLSGMSDQLALQIRQFLGRAGELHPTARQQLGDALCSEVAAVTAPPPPPGTPGPAYLAAVLAERRRREGIRMASITARSAAHEHGSADAGQLWTGPDPAAPLPSPVQPVQPVAHEPTPAHAPEPPAGNAFAPPS